MIPRWLSSGGFSLPILDRPPKLFRDATKLALTSPYGRFKLGAIIAKKRQIISMGTNRKKTHPIQARFSSRPFLNDWLHAETHSISLANAGDLIGSEIYVARITQDGTVANSRPCPGCLNALSHYGIQKMFYFQDGHYHKEEI
jgi:tRNA(Arg) A34 adenosine deaminase TadA